MLATLLHAMSSSNPTAAASVYSVVLNWPTMLSTQLMALHGELLWIVVGIDPGQAVRDDVHVRGGLLERHARLEPRLEHEIAAADVGIAPIQPDRPPEIRRQLGEPPRHDADERGWSAVEDERLSQYVRIAAVLLQPHLVGHHEDGRRARRGVGTV